MELLNNVLFFLKIVVYSLLAPGSGGVIFNVNV